MSDMKPVALRLPDDLAAKIDERVATVGVSRNEWLVRALEWVLEQPSPTLTREQRI